MAGSKVSLFRPLAFLRWLFAPERLPEETAETASASDTSDPTAHGARSILREIWVFETLPEDPPEDGDRRPKHNFTASLRWLFAREPLPMDEVDDANGRSQPQVGIRWLLSREPLPFDAPRTETAPRTGVSLGWLFGRERLDDREDTTDQIGEPKP